MRQKIIATGIGLTLVSLAAVGAFASQDAVNTLVVTPTATDTATATGTITATDTPNATETATATGTVTSTDTPTATGTPGASDTATATPTPAPSGTPQATDTPGASETPGGGDVHGIPSTNPNHPDGGDAASCTKGQSVIKTTPSGNRVRVPCQAAQHSGSHGQNGAN